MIIDEEICNFNRQNALLMNDKAFNDNFPFFLLCRVNFLSICKRLYALNLILKRNKSKQQVDIYT